MNIDQTHLPGVLEITPERHDDARGWLFEAWSADAWREAGLPTSFAQDAVSRSGPGVLRGLHLQVPRCQGKLVYVLRGAVWDVAVDARVGSPRFGKWTASELTAGNRRQVWIPPGLAHGFLAGPEGALLLYKCTEPYDPDGQRAIRWDDPDLAIRWPGAPRMLNERDRDAPRLRDIPEGELPAYSSFSADAR